MTDHVRRKIKPTRKMPKQWEDCPRCDGCGWYEGGKTLQTECDVCKGTGRIPPGVIYQGENYDAERKALSALVDAARRPEGEHGD